MVAAVPDDIRLFGPLRPMRFEAHVQDCVVVDGQIPSELQGGTQLETAHPARLLDTVLRRNERTGAEEAFTIDTEEQSAVLCEPTFAPRSIDAAEGNGYLIEPISHFMENTSEYQIFDTQDFASGPVA